jgi:hypothetical protein
MRPISASGNCKKSAEPWLAFEIPKVWPDWDWLWELPMSWLEPFSEFLFLNLAFLIFSNSASFSASSSAFAFSTSALMR